MKDRSTGDLFSEFKSALEALPDVRLKSALGWINTDRLPGHRVMRWEICGLGVDLFVVPRLNAYPRDVRSALGQFEELQEVRKSLGANEPSELFVLISPLITETSRTLLREHGYGYWDRSGSLYLPLPNGLLDIARPISRGDARTVNRPFRGRAQQVLHAMLVSPDREWKINDLALEAGVSAATAHRVVDYLEQSEWVKSTGRGPSKSRTLTKPGALLDAWKNHYEMRRYTFRRFYRWTRQNTRAQVQEVGRLLDNANCTYATTLSSGALFVAPHVTSIPSVAMLVSTMAGLSGALAQAGYEEVDAGENLLILVTDEESPLLFRQHIEDVWIASNIQLYLDLSAWPQRGKEQAEHLRRVRLTF